MRTLITSDPDHQNTYNGWSPLRWAPDYPGLAGKDLSPKGTITQFHGSTGGTDAERTTGAPADQPGEEIY